MARIQEEELDEIRRGLSVERLVRFLFSSRRRHTSCYRDWSSDVCSSDLLRAPSARLLDPDRLWAAMMRDEKPGGHGERSVAVGAIDMAVWDAVAKVAGKPLFRLLAERHGREADPHVFVYAAGGYYAPDQGTGALRAELRG